jgi:hypothetical protein
MEASRHDEWTSDELFEFWEQTEREGFAVDGQGCLCVPPKLREGMVNFIRAFTMHITQEEQVWNQAAVLLDCFVCNGGGVKEGFIDVDVVAAFATIAVKSIDQVVLHKLGFSQLSLLLQKFLRCDVEKVSGKRLREAEMHILDVLKWRTALPTVSDWSNAFLTRISLHTDEVDLVCKVKQTMTNWVTMCTNYVGANAALPPKTLAIGVVALSLMYCNALSVRSCRPREVSEDQWANIPAIRSVSQVLIKGQATNERDSQPVSAEMCALATGCSVESFRSKVYVVLDALDGVMKSGPAWTC